MKTLLCTLLAMILAPALIPDAAAQRELIWTPDRENRITVPLPYNHVDVVDDRDDKAGIGWLKTGAFNRYGTLVPDTPLGQCLTLYTNDILAQNRNSSPGELLVVLRSFWLEDRKGAEEIGTVHLRADLFRAAEHTQAYRHIRLLDTLYETKSGWDVTAALKVMASQAIIDLLQAGAELPRDEMTYTREHAVERRRHALLAWPVYTTGAVPKGVYRSFDDFLQVRPTDTNITIVRIASMDGPPVSRFYHTNRKGKAGKAVRLDSCFAVSDGTDWYVSRRGGFSKLRREGGEFLAVQQLRGLTDNAVVWSAAFGLLGAAIASSDQSKHYTRYLTCLDPENRRFVPWSRVR